MGAWATGTNTGIAMAQIAMVKNTGPDLARSSTRCATSGPGSSTSSPRTRRSSSTCATRSTPRGSRGSDYRISGLVGGEGMTEALRDYLEERFVKVRSGYGASDLTIGMAGETDFSVWLRRRLRTDAGLRARCSARTSTGCRWCSSTTRWRPTWRPTPTARSSARSTRRRCSTPRCGTTSATRGGCVASPGGARRPASAARAADARGLARSDRMRLPLLFLFGRKRQHGLVHGGQHLPAGRRVRPVRRQPVRAPARGVLPGARGARRPRDRPVVHLQLREDAALDEAARPSCPRAAATGWWRTWLAVSRDFAQSLEEDPSAGDLRVGVHDSGTGPFAGGDIEDQERLHVRSERSAR